MLQTAREHVLRESSACCHHAAHLYVDEASLLEAVHLYISEALDRGGAALLIAVPSHLRGMTERLADAGRDVDALRAGGQLTLLDAREAEVEIMRGGAPDRTTFESMVRPLIEAAQQKFETIAAYGEIVDILWQRRQVDAADTIEQWWNDLIAEYGISLLCGYRADPLDFHVDVQQGITRICRTHTHLIPVVDYERLDRAFDGALQRVFHNGDADTLRRHLLERCRSTSQMPPAQAALLALHDILPSLAQEVRMAMRDLDQCG